jgi:hypothetical protein
MGHGIASYGDITLGEFKKFCSEWIKNRQWNNIFMEVDYG